MFKNSNIRLLGAFLMASSLLTGGEVQATEDGEQLFKFYCAQCHGMEGKGDGPNVTPSLPVTPRNFSKKAEMNKLSDADLRNVITDGGPSLSKSPMMPPWSKTLDNGQIDLIIGHLRKLCDCKGKQ